MIAGGPGRCQDRQEETIGFGCHAARAATTDADGGGDSDIIYCRALHYYGARRATREIQIRAIIHLTDAK